jgi:hypothetical protein
VLEFLLKKSTHIADTASVGKNDTFAGPLIAGATTVVID